MAAKFKTFANFETLTADEINAFLMRQSVIWCGNKADRDAIPSVQTGMCVYRIDLGALQIALNSSPAWRTVAGYTFGYWCRQTAVSSANAAWVPVNFPVQIQNQSNEDAAVARNASTFTTPADGLARLWRINASVSWVSNATGRRIMRLMVDGFEQFRSGDVIPVNGNFTTAQLNCEIVLGPGVNVVLESYQSSGAALDLVGEQSQTFITFSGRPV